MMSKLTPSTAFTEPLTAGAEVLDDVDDAQQRLAPAPGSAER